MVTEDYKNEFYADINRTQKEYDNGVISQAQWITKITGYLAMLHNSHPKIAKKEALKRGFDIKEIIKENR